MLFSWSHQIFCESRKRAARGDILFSSATFRVGIVSYFFGFLWLQDETKPIISSKYDWSMGDIAQLDREKSMDKIHSWPVPLLRSLTRSRIAKVAALLEKVLWMLNPPTQKTEEIRNNANTKSRRTE